MQHLVRPSHASFCSRGQPDGSREAQTDRYTEPDKLKQTGCFQGGSAIGEGVCVRKSGVPAPVTEHLSGYIRVSAENLHQAKSLLIGNPHFEAGGTVEIRELPRTD